MTPQMVQEFVGGAIYSLKTGALCAAGSARKSFVREGFGGAAGARKREGPKARTRPPQRERLVRGQPAFEDEAGSRPADCGLGRDGRGRSGKDSGGESLHEETAGQNGFT